MPAPKKRQRKTAPDGTGKNKPYDARTVSKFIAFDKTWKGRECELTIDRLDDRFLGVAALEERTVFVEGVLPGEKVVCKISAERQGDLYADPVRITKPSAERVRPVCPSFENCGNCHLQYASQSVQLQWKRQLVQDVLAPFLEGAEVPLPVAAYYPLEYRNKIHLAVDRKNGKTVVGFFRENTKTVVPIPYCKLHGDWAATLISVVEDYVRKFKIVPFSASSEKGTLRYVTARCFGKKILVTVVSAKSKIYGLPWLYKELKKHFEEVGLWLNVNAADSSAVYSDRFLFVEGKPKLTASVLGVEAELTPQTFYQVNEKIAAKAYRQAAEWLGGGVPVVDAFSGVGITSVLFARLGCSVVSVEMVEESVKEAARIAQKNGLEQKIECLCGDCNEVLPTLSGGYQLFLDPPRRGCGEGTQKAVLKMKPQTIVYLSCNPQTLAQDIAAWQGAYRITAVQPYDFFSQTKHVEVLVKLERKEKEKIK